MKDKTLVILAAGMGSRFGGPKQLHPVGPNGEFIMDYSIYSALKYGFNKVVFVTRKELLEEFKNTIGSRIDGLVDVGYTLQELSYMPEGFVVPEGREKPWGTAHAIYCAKDEVNSNFAVITADDFYGDEAFKDLSSALDKDSYSVIGYHLGDTLSDNGPVKRGVVISHDGIVDDIIESTCFYDKDINKVVCTPLNENIKPFNLEYNNSVSMLMYGFTPDVMNVIENEMENAFETNKDKLDKYEFLMPDIMSLEIKRGRTILDIPTHSKWVGVTYQEDVDALKLYIKSLIENSTYPEDLWQNVRTKKMKF